MKKEKTNVKRFKKIKKDIKGITLIALVVTIIVLIILASVTINVLFGEIGLITMAQKAKNEYEEAAKNEEQVLAGMFGKNFADYNGRLSVVDGKLVNQYGEGIVLRGLNSESVDQYSIHYAENQGWNYYINDDSVDTLKTWGVNVIRLGIQIDQLNNTQLLNDYYDTIDLLTQKDIYVLIVLWNSKNINDNIEQAQSFFEDISNKYKTSSNILYEIANEPTINWDKIKSYSETIINTIRQNDSQNIIIVPNPDYDSRPDLINISELTNSYNVMTSYHMYVGNQLTSERIGYLEQAIENGTPIFVTEWGTTLSNGNDGFYESESNIFIKIMDKYNLSWCNYRLTDFNFRVGQGYGQEEYSGIVQHDQWNNSLSDNTLTASGKYIKNILQGTYKYTATSQYAMMVSRNNNYAFWQDDYRENITSIEFKKQSEVPQNAITVWDMSISKDNSIQAYIINDEGYKLFIISDNIIRFPNDTGAVINENGAFFQDFTNVVTIKFDNVDTSGCRDFGGLFQNCKNVVSIDGLDKFDVSNVKYMNNVFFQCHKLQNLNLDGWNTSKVVQSSSMFNGCNSLIEISGIENWSVENIVRIHSMFQQIYNMKNINLAKWKLSLIASTDYMFAWNNATEIDIRNFDMSQVTSVAYMFKGTSNLENLYMNNVTFNIDSITNYTEMFNGIKNGVNIYVKNEEIAEWIYDRITEANKTANIYYGTDDNWTEYTI